MINIMRSTCLLGFLAAPEGAVEEVEMTSVTCMEMFSPAVWSGLPAIFVPSLPKRRGLEVVTNGFQDWFNSLDTFHIFEPLLCPSRSLLTSVALRV